MWERRARNSSVSADCRRGGMSGSGRHSQNERDADVFCVDSDAAEEEEEEASAASSVPMPADLWREKKLILSTF